jgi:hypothetical protein
VRRVPDATPLFPTKERGLHQHVRFRTLGTIASSRFETPIETRFSDVDRRNSAVVSRDTELALA